jgi:hypothetical protein
LNTNIAVDPANAGLSTAELVIHFERGLNNNIAVIPAKAGLSTAELVIHFAFISTMSPGWIPRI